MGLKSRGSEKTQQPKENSNYHPDIELFWALILPLLPPKFYLVLALYLLSPLRVLKQIFLYSSYFFLLISQLIWAIMYVFDTSLKNA